MHELLQDCSERTLAVEVDHTPPVSVQPWKIHEEWRKWTNSLEECYAEQRSQTQKAMPTQVDQISPSTSRRCDYYVHSACITGVLSLKHSVCLHTSRIHLQQIHVLQNRDRDHV